MDRATRERRTPRRVLSVLATFALVVGMLVIVAPGADAVVNTCKARNLTKGTPVDTNLQRVIKAASPGDTISVKYVCVGHFTIAKKLFLVGKATAAVPKPVLNGNGTGRTLLVSAQVRLTNLKITGGRSDYGGGIYNTGSLTLKDTVVRGNTATGSGIGVGIGGGIKTVSPATLTLNGSSSVSGNTATYTGGGVSVSGSTLTLNGSSSVSGNTATFGGGGILSANGIITLNDSSSVSGNTADGFGGGIAASGYDNTLTLNGSSSVSGNTSSSSYGGGIDSFVGVVTLNDSSSVTGNTAAGLGGGISMTNDGAPSALTLNDSSFVSGNRAGATDLPNQSGGGIFASCDTTLTGAVDGVNVNDNYLGSTGTTEDNISIPCA